jgi:hypothetical protein
LKDSGWSGWRTVPAEEPQSEKCRPAAARRSGPKKTAGLKDVKEQGRAFCKQLKTNREIAIVRLEMQSHAVGC